MKIKNWKPKGMRIDYDSPEVLAELRREDEVFGRFVNVKKVRIACGREVECPDYDGADESE
jgi:hypothetical protein